MANLILRPHIEVPVPTLEFRIQGLIGWELSRGGIIIEKSDPKPNLIVDSGLDALGGTGMIAMTAYCSVGTSNTAPANGQTGLIAPVTPRTNFNGGIADTTGQGSGVSYFWRKNTRVFLEAEANGNLTEVGYFSAASGGTMFNRQLLLNDLGVPTTITKTNTEQLKITLETRIYPIKTQTTQNFTIGGVSTDILNQVINLTFGNWNNVNFGSWNVSSVRSYETNVMPAVTADQPVGTQGSLTSSTLQAYSAGSYQRDTIIVADPGVSNFATGFGALAWGPNAGGGDFWFCHTFTPKVAKDNTKRFTIQCRCAWARH